MWYFNPTTFVCYLTLKSSVSLNYNSDFFAKKVESTPIYHAKLGNEY